MKIEWMAHSCFVITLADGTRILTDPFENKIGYELKDMQADIVLVSHDHFDHNYLDAVSGEYTLIRTAGEHTVGNVKITGIPTWHDGEKGALRGENIVFKIEADGLSLAHMGDLGEVPGEDFFQTLGQVDILMIPVGGVYTVDGEQALTVCKTIEPNIILPMHYKTLFLDVDVQSVFHFTDPAGGYYDKASVGDSVLEITAGNKKKRSRIVLLSCALDK